VVVEECRPLFLTRQECAGVCQGSAAARETRRGGRQPRQVTTRMLTYGSRMLTYAHVCSRMLTYAGGKERRFERQDKDKEKGKGKQAVPRVPTGAGEVKVDISRAHSLFYLPCLRKVSKQLKFLDLVTAATSNDPSVHIYWQVAI
jgi:hypothetical protein